MQPTPSTATTDRRRATARPVVRAVAALVGTVLVIGTAIAVTTVTTQNATSVATSGTAEPIAAQDFRASVPDFQVPKDAPYANVLALQYLLRANGIAAPTTGKYDSATTFAVRHFQSKNKLKVDGQAGFQTMSALLSPTITGARVGWTNPNTTRAVQALLVKVDIPQKQDGTFGTGTRDAVMKFQKTAGVQVDGVVRPRTWSALFNAPRGGLTGGANGQLGVKIAEIARRELNNNARNREIGGYNCNFYSGYFGRGAYGCPGGFRSEAWCADFSMYVWQQAGANTSGLSALAASFPLSYGKDTNHRTQPRVGDAVTYSWDADGEVNHVEIVVAVDYQRGTFDAIGGNTGSGSSRIAVRSGMPIGGSTVYMFTSPVAG